MTVTSSTDNPDMELDANGLPIREEPDNPYAETARQADATAAAKPSLAETFGGAPPAKKYGPVIAQTPASIPPTPPSPEARANVGQLCEDLRWQLGADPAQIADQLDLDALDEEVVSHHSPKVLARLKAATERKNTRAARERAIANATTINAPALNAPTDPTSDDTGDGDVDGW